MSRYRRRKVEEVNAFEYTEPLSCDLIDLLKRKAGLYFFERNKFYVNTRISKKLVELGDMIVELPDGTLDVQKPELFNMKYEEVR